MSYFLLFQNILENTKFANLFLKVKYNQCGWLSIKSMHKITIISLFLQYPRVLLLIASLNFKSKLHVTIFLFLSLSVIQYKGENFHSSMTEHMKYAQVYVYITLYISMKTQKRSIYTDRCKCTHTPEPRFKYLLVHSPRKRSHVSLQLSDHHITLLLTLLPIV